MFIEIKCLAQDHIASQWQRQGVNLDFLALNFMFLLLSGTASQEKIRIVLKMEFFVSVTYGGRASMWPVKT